MKNIRRFILVFFNSILFCSTVSAAGPLNPMPSVFFSHEATISGFDISCNGGTATVGIFVGGGSPPYTYEWRNSSGTLITTDLNLPLSVAGTYTLTLFKNGNHSSWDLTLTEPEVIDLGLDISAYEGGFNISQNGGSDGYIKCIASGGAGDYYYVWSTGTNWDYIDGLTAGTYSIKVIDYSGCEVDSTISLTEPPPLQIVSITSPTHNGFNVSCYGGHNGAINLTITGGTPPYSFDWGTGVYTEDRDSLPAGNYSVIVDDANPGGQDTAYITLTQPTALSLILTSPTYAGGFNTSCYNCRDASIVASASGGVSPYTYLWNNGSTTPSIDSLGKEIDTVTVTDNIGCIVTGSYEIMPDLEAWKIGGNLGVNSTLQFVGTKDSTDFVIKTSNTERLQITKEGKIKFSGLAKPMSQLMILNMVGELETGGDFVGNEVGTACSSYPATSPWYKSTSIGPSGLHDIVNCEQRFSFGVLQPQERVQIQGFARFVNGVTASDYLNIGHNGNATINSYGNGELLINCNSPQNVKIATGLTRGNVITGGNTYLAAIGGRVGIRNTSPKDDLEIGNLFTLHNDPVNSWIGYNNIWSGTNNQWIQDGNASRLTFGSGGEIKLEVGGSGLATNPISFRGLTVNNDGKVSINTATHDKYLTVGGDVQFLNGGTQNNFQITYGSDPIGRGIRIDDDQSANVDFVLSDYQNGTFRFISKNSTHNTRDRLLTINGSGGVAIGNGNQDHIPGDYTLAVYGKIITEEVTVALRGAWPDYVFNKNYCIKSLPELKEFISKNSHLPGLPSSAEVDKSGISLGDIVTKQMEKIEELTLYILSLQEQIDELKNKK